MAMAPLRVVLDTNVLISSFGFGGKPRQILFEVLKRRLVGITSEVLLAELVDVLAKKFKMTEPEIQLIDFQMRKDFKLVTPRKAVSVLEDDADNRVLEAAVEGQCSHIISGDKDLLNLKNYLKIEIVNASDFLGWYQKFFSSIGQK